MRRLTAIVLCVLVAACAAGAGAPTPAPSASGPHAADLQATFLLEFALPRDTWKAGEPIAGTATLSLVQGSGVDLGGSGGGLLGFDFASVDGSHHIEPAWTQDCAAHRLEAGKPMTSPIRKSGGFYPERPDFEFNRDFLTDPVVHLPAGDWKVTAVASFVEGLGCSGRSRTMRATILVHITP